MKGNVSEWRKHRSGETIRKLLRLVQGKDNGGLDQPYCRRDELLLHWECGLKVDARASQVLGLMEGMELG